MKRVSELLILIAGIFWGLAGIFVASLSKSGFSPVQISAIRWIFSATILLAATTIFRPSLLKIRFRDVGWFFCTGILCILLSSTLYFTTIPLTTAAVANILMYTSPIWIMIFSVILFKEKITIKKVVILFLAVFGCALATGIFSCDEIHFSPLGIITGICSGLFYGLYSIFGKYVLKKYSAVTVILYTTFFAGIGSFFMINIPETASLFVDTNALLPSALLAVTITILPYSFYTIGLKNCRATKASVLCCVEPITSAILGTLVLNQPFTLFQIFGVFMILVAGILLQIKKQK